LLRFFQRVEFFLHVREAAVQDAELPLVDDLLRALDQLDADLRADIAFFKVADLVGAAAGGEFLGGAAQHIDVGAQIPARFGDRTRGLHRLEGVLDGALAGHERDPDHRKADQRLERKNDDTRSYGKRRHEARDPRGNLRKRRNYPFEIHGTIPREKDVVRSGRAMRIGANKSPQSLKTSAFSRRETKSACICAVQK
jgi:hypothetical protein